MTSEKKQASGLETFMYTQICTLPAVEFNTFMTAAQPSNFLFVFSAIIGSSKCHNWIKKNILQHPRTPWLNPWPFFYCGIQPNTEPLRNSYFGLKHFLAEWMRSRPYGVVLEWFEWLWGTENDTFIAEWMWVEASFSYILLRQAGTYGGQHHMRFSFCFSSFIFLSVIRFHINPFGVPDISLASTLRSLWVCIICSFLYLYCLGLKFALLWFIKETSLNFAV